MVGGSSSPELKAFSHYLRTGRWLSVQVFIATDLIQHKFNPYHDPNDGRFTFGPGGSGDISDGVYRPDSNAPRLVLTGAFETIRGIGDNGGPPLDPIQLDQAFPGLADAPAGAIIAIADSVLDLTGPANQMTSAMSLAYTNDLIAQIQSIDPSYRFESLGFPNTFEGQMREINQLRWDQAAAIYRQTGDAGPLQVETIRFLQDRTDAEYDNALAAAKDGRLPLAPTERMAIGNYVDKAVKADFRDTLAAWSRSGPTGQAVLVNSREYDNSGDDTTYSIPDARIRDVAFDITLYPKGSSTRQIRNFFNTDFRPKAVIIIRPRQLGLRSSYIIKRSGK